MNKYKLILPNGKAKYFKFGDQQDAYIKAFREMLAYADYYMKSEYEIEFVERKFDKNGHMTSIYKILA